MDWIAASLFMFISSIGTYLCIRKCSLLKTPIVYQNLAVFAIPLLIYLFLAFTHHTSLQINAYQFGIIVIAAVFFSYLGNIFSLRSIEYAPNPGYSLILSKSYVLFTTVIAVIFLHGTITIRGGWAILLIIAASALVMIGKPKSDQSHVRSVWLPLAIGSFFCWGMLAIVSKYLLDIGVPIYTRLIYVMTIVSILILTEMKFSRAPRIGLSKTHVYFLLAAGIMSAAFNYFQQLGYQLAPNIGYVNAINAASIAGVSLCSAWIFGDELNKRKFIGIIGVTIGIILLVI